MKREGGDNCIQHMQFSSCYKGAAICGLADQISQLCYSVLVVVMQLSWL
jgi:hypothetical protein